MKKLRGTLSGFWDSLPLFRKIYICGILFIGSFAMLGEFGEYVASDLLQSSGNSFSSAQEVILWMVFTFIVAALEAYVLTAVRNLALDRVAKTDNANVSLDDVQTDAFDSAPRPDEDMEQQESLKRVREIMSGLPEAQRTALQLREIEGHSYRETADIMNVSEANVKVLIFRARQAVKNKIDKIENYGL